MASRLPRSPVPSRAFADPEAGFTLVEVLAALVIAAMSIVLAFQLFDTSARVSARVVRETAARDLARTLLAQQASGEGRAGNLHWQAQASTLGPRLRQRRVAIDWPGGPVLQWDRLEPAGAGP